MATPLFKMATTIKNYVLSSPKFASDARALGLDRYTAPEAVVSILREGLEPTSFKELVDMALNWHIEQRKLAREEFGI